MSAAAGGGNRILRRSFDRPERIWPPSDPAWHWPEDYVEWLERPERIESLTLPVHTDPDGNVLRFHMAIRIAAWMVDAMADHNYRILARDFSEPIRQGSGSWQQRWASQLEEHPDFAAWLQVGVQAVYVAARLSDRQIEALEWKMMGLPLPEIAEEMGIQKATARSYLQLAREGLMALVLGQPRPVRDNRSHRSTGRLVGRPRRAA